MPPTTHRRGVRGAALTLVAVVAVVAAGFGAWRANQPSPVQDYVRSAVAVMDEGLFADTPAWERTREETLQAAEDYDSIEEAYPDLKVATAIAGGAHSSFHTPEEAQRRAEAAHEAATQRRPEAQLVDGAGVAVLKVPGFNTTDETAVAQFAQSGIRAIAGTAARCGWIIDLRQNTGGNMYPMLGAVSPLLTTGPVLHFDYPDGDRSTITVSNSAIRLGNEERLQLQTPARNVGRPHVAVVYGQNTASAGEGLALAFQGQAYTRSFGHPTSGFSTANSTTTMDDGALIVMTVAVMTARDDTSRDGGRLLPDERTPAIDEADPIEQATSWLTAACEPSAP